MNAITAFLDEVRSQRELARQEMAAAAERQDEDGVRAAAARIEDLDELVARNCGGSQIRVRLMPGDPLPTTAGQDWATAAIPG